MKFNNLPNEIYYRIIEYLDSQQDIYELMTVCKASHLPAKKLYYAQVRLYSNYRSFLTFLKNVQGGITPRYIKMLHISDSPRHYQEFYTVGEFIYIIQSLKGLKTLELEGTQTDWYLHVMLTYIQIEDLTQIKRIIISKGQDAETKKRYLKLLYKLCETITHLSVYPPLLEHDLQYFSKFKSLTHLEINFCFPRDMDFIAILCLHPKLQSLILAQSYVTPPLSPSKKLIVHHNLKYLDLTLREFPRHYLTYITSCIPPTIDHFGLEVMNDKKNWILSGFAETMLVDQFLAHLSKIKDMKLALARKIQQRTHPGCVDMMAKTWHFANSIRGRREKMITKAHFMLLSPEEYHPICYNFRVRENKYFYINLQLYLDNESWGDIPTNNMESSAMINCIVITPWCDTDVLRFIRYIVKRCTRLSRIYVLNESSLTADHIIFAPVPTRTYREDETTLPHEYLTTSTKENILFASYSNMFLHKSFLRPISQMFPKIQAVRFTGCDFEEPIIRINLRGLEHLRRIELDLKQIYRKESVLFAVHLEHYGTVNYFFKRLIQGLPKIMGPFELISKSGGWPEQEDCIVISIFCFKVEELEIQWSYADERYPTTSGLLIPYTVHPLSDCKPRSYWTI
jgi:hypothetical protein